MDIIVLAKYVPNPQGVAELGADFLAIRQGVDSALDPTDEYGVEAALKLAEEAGGTVTALCMGPEEAIAGLRRALAMGAHEAVLVSDPALRGSDCLATARVLAAAIKRRPCDLIVAGTESTDGYTGVLPMELAEVLDMPSATFARRVSVNDGVLSMERQTESGYDVVKCSLPALITVTSGCGEPRYPTMKGVMQAKKKPLEKLTLGDLGLSQADVAPQQKVVSVADAPQRVAGEVFEADEETTARIADFLAGAKVI
jgi:electron transfer flavoprotein beta subunit